MHDFSKDAFKLNANIYLKQNGLELWKRLS